MLCILFGYLLQYEVLVVVMKSKGPTGISFCWPLTSHQLCKKRCVRYDRDLTQTLPYMPKYLWRRSSKLRFIQISSFLVET